MNLYWSIAAVGVLLIVAGIAWWQLKRSAPTEAAKISAAAQSGGAKVAEFVISVESVAESALHRVFEQFPVAAVAPPAAGTFPSAAPSPDAFPVTPPAAPAAGQFPLP